MGAEWVGRGGLCLDEGLVKAAFSFERIHCVEAYAVPFWRVVMSILIAISWVVPWSAQFGELTSTRFNVEGGCEENVFVLWLLTRIFHVIKYNMSRGLASHCLESGSLRRLSDGIYPRLSFKIHLFDHACS